jgi:hypothetical protein
MQMNAERADRHLNVAIDNLNNAHRQLAYIRQELVGSQLAADMDVLLETLDGAKRDVSAMIRKVEETSRKTPGPAVGTENLSPHISDSERRARMANQNKNAR